MIEWVVLGYAVGLSACGPESPATVTRPLPALSFGAGDSYFVINGTPRPLMTRNITGESVAAIDSLLDQAAAAGDTLIRLHLIHGLGDGITPAGEVDEAWAAEWDAVFDHASSVGLHVMPVFGVWADWNDGIPDYGFANWPINAWNAANGGPASDPGELWQAGSVVQNDWMAWLGTLVDRWQGRPNVAAWEVFSELDIASGVDETSGAAFAAEAASIVRSEDTGHRPVMASLTVLNDWPTLNASDTVDILQVHGYADPLDSFLISQVTGLLAEYGKPVMIGESGLSAAAPTGNTDTTEPNAALDVRHAIWAGVVSGSMTARSLWWEDGYAIYEPAGTTLVDDYADTEAAAATFVGRLDFTGVAPLGLVLPPELVGGAVGNASQIIGWVRNATCTAPAPDCGTLSAESLLLPGGANTWTATFYDTSTGQAMPGPITVVSNGSALTLSLPAFTDDLAFTLVPAAAAPANLGR